VGGRSLVIRVLVRAFLGASGPSSTKHLGLGQRRLVRRPLPLFLLPSPTRLNRLLPSPNRLAAALELDFRLRPGKGVPLPPSLMSPAPTRFRPSPVNSTPGYRTPSITSHAARPDRVSRFHTNYHRLPSAPVSAITPEDGALRPHSQARLRGGCAGPRHDFAKQRPKTAANGKSQNGAHLIVGRGHVYQFAGWPIAHPVWRHRIDHFSTVQEIHQ